MDTSFLVLLNFYFVFTTNFFQTSSCDIFCQLQIGTCQEHLPASERQQRESLPPGCAAAAADLLHPREGLQGGE